LSDIELNPLSLFQRAVAAALDLRVVDEDIRGAVVGGDEAEALFAVEPFHSSLCHIFCTSFIRSGCVLHPPGSLLHKRSVISLKIAPIYGLTF
jgi:hypothetical protein